MTAPKWFTDGFPHIWLPYSQMQTTPTPLAAHATKGCTITLEDGRELTDGIASWWTACHGYNPPHVIEAMKAQLDLMPHVMFGGLNHEPALKLAKRLADMLPGDLNRVFFVDSGSVSVEVAMKMSIQYWINKGIKGRSKFVSFKDGYHGDTLGCMSIADPEEGMHHVFNDVLFDQFVIDVPRTAEQLAQFETFLEANKDQIAGVITEPLVQGAGGMKMFSPDVLKNMCETVQKHGLLFIVDEIFTGFGRTGSMFAIDHAEIVPDIICLSKALTAGVCPLACAVAQDHIFDAFLSDNFDDALQHGPTYMANPLACAAANASLDLFESEPRLEQVAHINKKLTQNLAPMAEIKGVKDVRTLGAIGVVQVDDIKDSNWLKKRFVEEGVWLRPFRDIIYLTPAFTISDDELDKLTDTMMKVLTQWSEL
ncbi:adenosylmethionine--8-amino-7-oxononanoate transaminase [Terasakiella sp. SH-1]|uniref:adenosylmethionine--8-amino-7-oxononanoate transaminase n=1 Tax=Terasakiella sp. SH-1 TaxID=2560057 RepID=UPI0010734B94|nr:adenosylmethionine--8-amino-7-oxononanoate transaminase [Terasakiella sp. SH-1]